MADKRETGQDATLNIAGTGTDASSSDGTYGTDFDITNVSYSLDSNTSESQFNSSFDQNLVFTGSSFSGSFEHDGSNEELRSKVRDKNGHPKDPSSITITIQEAERTVMFWGVIVSSRSKDMPADDRTSESYDFTAEQVSITTPE